MQELGSLLLVLAFIAALEHCICGAAVLLSLVGVIDLYLIFVAKEKTVSYFIRSLFPPYVDYVVMVLIAGIVFMLCNWEINVWFVLGILSNHFFEIQNRKGK